jgi:MFS family permease
VSDTRNNLTLIVFGLSLAYFAAYQQFKLPVVLPVLLAEYDYDRTLAGGFMSIYALAGLLLSVWLGRLIDRAGVARAIVWAMGLIIAGAGLTLLLPQDGLAVLAGRGLEGIAFAVLAISGPVMANAGATPRQLPLVAGLTAVWIPAGQLTAALLASLALASFGWQLLWVVAIAGAIAFAAWTLRLQASGRLTPAARGGAENAAGHALSRRQYLILAATGAIFTLWSGQYFAYMTWLPQYLIEVHDMGVSGALFGYIVPVSLVILFCIVTGMLRRAGLPLGYLLVAALASQAAVWWFLPLTQGVAGGLISLTVYGSGAGVVAACLFGLPSLVLGRGHGMARAFGIVMTGRNLGVLIGPVLLAQAFKLSGNWELAQPIFGSIATLALGLAIALMPRLATSQVRVAD